MKTRIMTTTTDSSLVYSGWLYKGKPVEDEDLKGKAGFVYLITDLTTNRRYVGRKYLKFSRKLKRSDKRRTTFESDWRDYWGSSEELHKLVEEKGNESFKREIIAFGKTKGEVNYAEVFIMFLVGAMESEDWINESCNKWRKKNVMKYEILSEIRKFFS